MISDVPRLFDPIALLRLQRRSHRSIDDSVAPPISTTERRAHNFLLEQSCELLVERLQMVRRTFKRVLVVGLSPPGFANDFASSLVVDHDVDWIDQFGRDIGSEARGLDQGLATPALGDAGLSSRLESAEVTYDLVISPLGLQTINDVPGILALIRRALVPDGLFVCNLIGGRSLNQLRQCLLQAEMQLTGGASPRVHPMIDVRDMGTLLQRAGFALPVTDGDAIDVAYADAIGLMRDLRLMGLSNALVERSRLSMRRSVLFEAARLYGVEHRTDKGGVRATFEFVSALGWAPHESQQKALKRGSATNSLADILPSRANDVTKKTTGKT